MSNCIFIFRRDLRLTDNSGFIYAMKNYDNVIPIFIFTPEQITRKNKFKSNNAIQFMIESLHELDNVLREKGSKLYIFKGTNISILTRLLNKIDIKGIVFNQDYTPYAKQRDDEINSFCVRKQINCDIIEDYLLAPIGDYLKDDGSPYTVFTPFKRNALRQKPRKPSRTTIRNVNKISLRDDGYINYSINDNIAVRGGRSKGLKKLRDIKKLKDYGNMRNELSFETTMLSAYIKFGCLSIREVYWEIEKRFGKDSVLMSQLFWREFYFYIVNYYPRVLKGDNFNKKYDKIKWKKSKKHFQDWCDGKTGYPVVDACMKQLNTTGYMHNRGRLISSNFLNRMLGLDWREGEKYFAQKLVDYDPSVNNGNWQWIASTGTDPKPYFQRLFNPMLQSERFDSEATYIKTWLPKLKDIPPQHLHKWGEYFKDYDLDEIDYVKPIVEYKKARKESIEMYRRVL